MEEVADIGNLRQAYRKVRANRGAPGPDGMTVTELGRWLAVHVEALRRELLEGRYKPQPVRGVAIPKPGGGERMLGIPNVLDRLIQQALLQKLEPIFDPLFSGSSFGFRPGRSAHDALRQGRGFVREDRVFVVDLDLEKFFDRVNHDVLMSRVARRVDDKRVLGLIRRFLTAGLMSNGVCVRREEGTPQGGPLSPLLANILLDDMDKELERRGHRFCRYADDLNIYVSSPKAGERVMASVTRFLEQRLKLRVNREKSAVDHVSRRKFLGYRLLGPEAGLGIHPKSVERFKDKVRALTRRNGASELPKVVAGLNRLIVGWMGYFHLGRAKALAGELDSWIRRKLRCLKLKRCKRAAGIGRFLLSRGLDQDASWTLAGSGKGWWRLSKTRQAHQAMDRAWFRELGLVSLSDEFARLST
jgi:RNA-directed DNA polymerase